MSATAIVLLTASAGLLGLLVGFLIGADQSPGPDE